MITIIDYGVGNVRAFLNMFRRQNIDAVAASQAKEVRAASKLILPGVGHFDDAMRRLSDSGLREVLGERVLSDGVPVLGVCVGMQMLAESSDEGVLPGLGWIKGTVRSLTALPVPTPVRLPHMGWNDVDPAPDNRLFKNLERDSRFYFLHSFYFECARAEDSGAVSHYGTNFSSAVHADNIYGVQFHPEKSHRFGTQLLLNFATL